MTKGYCFNPSFDFSFRFQALNYLWITRWVKFICKVINWIFIKNIYCNYSNVHSSISFIFFSELKPEKIYLRRLTMVWNHDTFGPFFWTIKPFVFQFCLCRKCGFNWKILKRWRWFEYSTGKWRKNARFPCGSKW